MKKLIILFFFPFACGQDEVPAVELIKGGDPDIVFVNIEEGNRAFIGNLLLQIDSLKPAVIAVNVMFDKEKDAKQDSVLYNAFKIIKNDVLIYWYDSLGKSLFGAKKFYEHVSGIGLTKFEYRNDLVTRFTPLVKEGNEIYESFPLTIVKHWKPGFKHNIKINQSVQIKYTRSAEQFLFINGSDFGGNVDPEALKNKVVLVGYFGPTEEDKFYTPLRLVTSHVKNQPDTYGLVIIANAIRTILEHGKSE